MKLGIRAAIGTRKFTTQMEKAFGNEERWIRLKKTLLPVAINKATYIYKQSANHFKLGSLDKLKVLDLGCGAGFVAEQLALLGCSVRGIDMLKAGIAYATQVASSNPKLSSRLKYDVLSSKQLLLKEPGIKYDIIVCSQVVEHVDNYSEIIQDIKSLLDEGGIAHISTDNRSISSWLLHSVIEECILKKRPIGTHTWKYLIKPEELQKCCQDFKLKQQAIAKINLPVSI